MDQAFVIRPVSLNDLEWFYSISHMVGTGFTSLPDNREYIKKRVTIVDQSFKEAIPVQERVYLFVRENLPSREIVGICGIDVDVGYKESFYNYQISTITQSNKELDIYMVHTLLNVVNNFQQASELITFWVHPNFRGQFVSKSLSLSRFLFIAQFPQWFNKTIVAEIRGYIDENGESPLWNALGAKFFGMTFKDADALTMTKGKQFIADLIAREPIYIDLLPEDAQRVIGLEHPEATPARYMLESQGFKFNNHVDIFDGGPLISADRDEIKPIAQSKLITISKIQDKLENTTYVLIYNCKCDLRVTEEYLQINADGTAIITQKTADILRIKPGDQVRYCKLKE